MAPVGGGRSIPELFTDVVSQLAALLRTEGQLARAEISENIGKVGAGLGLVAAGAILAIPALVILFDAAVAALIDYGIAAPWAAVIVGGLALLVGIVLLLIGVGRLKAERMVPYRTIHQLQLDASVAKDQVRQDDEQHRAA